MIGTIDHNVLASVLDDTRFILYPMVPSDLVFEERVKLNCFYCKNYNTHWKCPPKIPPIDYQKVVSEFEHGVFVKIELPFSESDFSEIRVRSTNDLHRSLLKLERYMWEHNYPLSISFIGGSCKLCKNGCGIEHCNNPYQARMSMEGAGINVVKSLEKYGLRIVFPPKNNLTRVGMLLW